MQYGYPNSCKKIKNIYYDARDLPISSNQTSLMDPLIDGSSSLSALVGIVWYHQSHATTTNWLSSCPPKVSLKTRHIRSRQPHRCGCARSTGLRSPVHCKGCISGHRSTVSYRLMRLHLRSPRHTSSSNLIADHFG
jgi:hypothetical protein